MDARTLEALQASIAKWERNAVAETPQAAKIYADSCALCQMYCLSIDIASCNGCPVSSATGEIDCDGSPWPAARQKWEAWCDDDAKAAAFHEAARAEVAFLKSLLPSEEAGSAL